MGDEESRPLSNESLHLALKESWKMNKPLFYVPLEATRVFTESEVS